jgi:hypothetical protein
MSGLAPFDIRTSGRMLETYHDSGTGDVWEAIGWITKPATILRNQRTGEHRVEVIGCLNAERLVRRENMSPQDAQT